MKRMTRVARCLVVVHAGTLSHSTPAKVRAKRRGGGQKKKGVIKAKVREFRLHKGLSVS